MIKFLLLTLWFIGFSVLAFTIKMIFSNPEELSKYLTSLGILISAFIASTTVLLTIQNSKNLEKVKERKEKKKNFSYLSQICNTTYMEIDKNKTLWPKEKMKKDEKLFSAYYAGNELVLTSQLTSSRKMFESLLTRLKDKDLYFYEELLSPLERLNTLLYEFNHMSNRLSFEERNKDDDTHNAHFFNAMQGIHMITEGTEEILSEMNIILMKEIPNIQSKTILNTGLTILNDNNLDLPFHERAKHMAQKHNKS